MMNKKDKGALGLGPATTYSIFNTNGVQVPLNPRRAASRSEQHILEEWNKSVAVMDGTRAKAILAMTLIADIHQHGAAVFDGAVTNILEVKDGQRGKEGQAYTEEFCVHGIQVLARHMLGVMEVGAANIGVEVHRSLYPPPEPEEKPPEPEPFSLRKWLFG